MATTCYNIVARPYIDRSSDEQEEKIEPPMGVLFFILFSPQTNFSFWSLRSPVCSDLQAKVTWESYIEKLHTKVT